MITIRAFTRVALACALLLHVLGCSSVRKETAHQEIVPANNQREFAAQLATNLGVKYGTYTNQSVSNYIEKLIQRIVSNSPELDSFKNRISVTLLKTEEVVAISGLAQDIFLSKGFLSTIRFESELAYILALQLSLIRDEATVRNFTQIKAQALGEGLGENMLNLPTAPPHREKDVLARDWFEPGGLFDFGQPIYLKADKDAVLYCYRAKIDPRGAVTFLQQSAQHDVAYRILPETDDRLTQAREEISRLSPIRDPLVKTDAFSKMQSQLKIRKAKQ